MSLPLSPSLASSAISTDMGVTGLAVTGGTFYNHLSSPGHRHPDHHHGGAAAAPQSPSGARSGPPPSASVCHLYIFSEETLGGGERKHYIIARRISSFIKQSNVSCQQVTKTRRMPLLSPLLYIGYMVLQSIKLCDVSIFMKQCLQLIWSGLELNTEN